MARGHRIIHTAGLHRESIASGCSAVRGYDAMDDIETAYTAFVASPSGPSGKKTDDANAALARMSMLAHAHDGRTTPSDIRIPQPSATTNDKVRAADLIASFPFMLV